MADRRLQVFHAVAKNLSFTKAADVLFMTQPAVTFQIKQFEEQLNTRLFERGYGHISLTPAGELLMQYAERILALSSEMTVRMAELTGEIAGSLSVGASMTIAEFMLPRIIGEFAATYSNARPRMIVGNSESIEARVLDHSLDLGFIESPSHLPGLATEPLCDDELVVICSPRFPLAKAKGVTPQLLLEHPYVSRDSGSGTRDFVEQYLRQAGINPTDLPIVMEMGSPNSLNGVLEAGRGFSIASRASVVKAQRLGELVTVPLKPRLIRTLSMVYPKEKFRTRLVSTTVPPLSSSTRL